MPRYTYSGRNMDGTSVQGQLAALDVSDLEAKLIERGIYLETSRPALTPFRQHLLRRFRAAELTRVTRQLQILLQSKVSVLEALDLVTDQIKDHSLRSIFGGVKAQVESGRTVAEALRDYPLLFDDLYTGMVEAGETSGRLDFAFDRIAGYREKTEATMRKVKSALAYPLLVILVAVCVVLALVLYVVPVFSSMYENFNAELPSLTRAVVGISTALRANAGYFITFAIMLLAGLFAATLTKRCRMIFDKLLVRTPLIRNLTIKIVSARFCRTMGSLLTGGVDILYALRISAKTTSNLYVTALLEPTELLLVEGKSLTDALQSVGMFPKAVLKLTASGEKTGQLGDMLSRAADYYESETDAEITTLTSLIEPMIIIILGGLVAFILIAMYLPLFELVGTV